MHLSRNWKNIFTFHRETVTPRVIQTKLQRETAASYPEQVTIVTHHRKITAHRNPAIRVKPGRFNLSRNISLKNKLR